MDKLFKDFIKEEIKKINITDTMTSYLVKRKKRGAYQALEESKEIEEEITEAVTEYITRWAIDQFIDGTLKEKMIKELKSASYLELVRKGFTDIKLK